jgi:hypothetical protein
VTLVWYAIPSAGPAAGARRCLEAWRDMGYRIAVSREKDAALVDLAEIHLELPYRGYQQTTNHLTHAVLQAHPAAQIIVAGGDDVLPDPVRGAAEIAEEFVEHFGGTLGVMQPIGDSSWSPKAHMIAWSPWLGRAWCERAYGGHGPFPPMYWHNRADIELATVARRLGLWWARPDLTQRHDRHSPGAPHLAHLAQHREADAMQYLKRRERGFPGAELAPA